MSNKDFDKVKSVTTKKNDETNFGSILTTQTPCLDYIKFLDKVTSTIYNKLKMKNIMIEFSHKEDRITSLLHFRGEIGIAMIEIVVPQESNTVTYNITALIATPISIFGNSESPYKQLKMQKHFQDRLEQCMHYALYNTPINDNDNPIKVDNTDKTDCPDETAKDINDAEDVTC